MTTVTWILNFYPRRWRERYQEEMLAVLEQHTISLVTLFDLLLGALDARLDPAYRTQEGFMLHTLGSLLAEGKTKQIYAHPTDSALGYMVNKDKITAGDGARRSDLAGK